MTAPDASVSRVPPRHALDSRWQLHVVGDALAFLLGDGESVALEGRLVCAVAQALEGGTDLTNLAERLAPEFDPLAVRHGLSLLEERGCLARDERGPPAPFSVPEPLPWEVGIGTPEALAAGSGPRLLFTEGYLAGVLEAEARSLREAGVDVLLAKPAGEEVWIGPGLAADGRPCWRCLAVRLGRCLRVHAFVHRARGGTSTRGSETRRAAHPEALEAARSAARSWHARPAGHPLADHLWTWDTRTGATALHRVLPVPGCPVCRRRIDSGPSASGPPDDGEPTVLSRLGALTWETGGAAEGGLERHLDPLTGIVSRLDGISAPGDPVHLQAASNPAARDSGGWTAVRESLRTRCVGKGTGRAEARFGALAEALERYSGVVQGDEATVRGSFLSLGPGAIHPNRVLLFSDLQYADRDAWNAREADANWVPERFDTGASLDWTPLLSLTHEGRRWLPTELLYYRAGGVTDLRGPEGPDSPFFRADSNGCAAGRSPGGAVLRGLLELAERDAVAVWWYNELRRPAVDVASFDRFELDDIVDRTRERHGEVVVFDVTHDLGIPTFAAVAHHRNGRKEELVLGSGAHLDAATALRRALLEMGQGVVSAAGPSPVVPAFDPETLDPGFLAPVPAEAGRCSFPRAPAPWGPEALDWCVARLRERGLEVMVLDQTRADAELPVARVVVPGLRPHWARLAGGRLYEVPVRMGWRPTPRDERDLNPSHLRL